MNRHRLILFLLLLLCRFSNAQSFDFNDNCRKAYNALIALRLEEGLELIHTEEKRTPDNLIPVYLENYYDFLTVYTADAKGAYEKAKQGKDLRMALLNSGDLGSPWCRFTQADVNLQWAALDIKFGEYMPAVFAIRRAFKFLEENKKYYPDFKPNDKSLGVLYALLGSVPDKYKWGVNLLGMEGNVDAGMKLLRNLIDYGKKNDFIYQDETITYYAFLLLNLQNQSDTAWQVLIENGYPKSNNLMHVYTCAHIGIYGRHTDEALKILNNQPKGDAYAQFPFLDYLTGLGKLNKLESDADSYFKKFIAGYKGQNHIRSAYQKIAWNYLMQGDTVNYRHFIKKALNKGAATLDADKQAKKEAEQGLMPHADLLKARLLFDGGYYTRAMQEMTGLTEAHFDTPDEQTEYLYRTARIYDESNRTDSALAYYQRAIEKGKNLTRYYAANSALESGRIYETRGDKEKAKYYYNLCLGFENHEYKDGLDQKAKAGLNRLQ